MDFRVAQELDIELKRSFMVLRGTFLVVVLLISTQVLGSTLSFKEWKKRRVAEKTFIVAQLKKDKINLSEAVQNKLAQAQFNLQTEKDLTPEDYFHLYLVEQFKSKPNQAKETAKSLSKEELAEIVVSYISATNQFQKIETSSSRLQTSR